MNYADPNLSSDAKELATSLQTFLSALVRRRRQFLAAFLGTVLAVQLAGFFWPGTYEAKAALLVEKLRSFPTVNRDPSDPTVTSAGITEEEVMSEVALLTSQKVLEATVIATGLDQARPSWYMRLLLWPLRTYERLYASYHDKPYPSDTERAIRGVAGSIEVERLKDSNILVVSYQVSDPTVAEIVLRELIKNYLEHHVAVHGQTAAPAFFNDQTALLEGELERQEDKLQTIKSDVGVVDAQGEREVQLSLDAKLQEEMSMLSRRLGELDAMIASADDTLSGASLDKDDASTAIVSDPALSHMRAEILRLEMEQVDMESRYDSDFPLVVENRQKLARARSALAEGQREVYSYSPTLRAVADERARLVTEREGVIERRSILQSQIEASRARLLELDQNVLEATRVQRLIRATETRYLMYLNQQERARIDDALDESRWTNVRVVQDATANAKPVRPKKLILLLASLGGGILSGLFLCVVLEMRELGLARILDSAAPKRSNA